ncbi:hypothetical protein NMY22_g18443 [Coprinellus aureogranulatus]|nr:hypothetical protein NMY22_g18443 [Coprinellus aureogranulatus]
MFNKQYMAPEIFKRTGHGKPVDVWAMGVITYFLLAGYTPFDRDTQEAEMKAIIAGDYKFEPEEYWQNVSETAKDFVRTCLTVDPTKRPTAGEALKHKVRLSPLLLSSLFPLLHPTRRYSALVLRWSGFGYSRPGLLGICRHLGKVLSDIRGRTR